MPSPILRLSRVSELYRRYKPQSSSSHLAVPFKAIFAILSSDATIFHLKSSRTMSVLMGHVFFLACVSRLSMGMYKQSLTGWRGAATKTAVQERGAARSQGGSKCGFEWARWMQKQYRRRGGPIWEVASPPGGPIVCLHPCFLVDF